MGFVVVPVAEHCIPGHEPERRRRDLGHVAGANAEHRAGREPHEPGDDRDEAVRHPARECEDEPTGEGAEQDDHECRRADECARRKQERVPERILRGEIRRDENVKLGEELGNRRRQSCPAPVGEQLGLEYVRALVVIHGNGIERPGNPENGERAQQRGQHGSQPVVERALNTRHNRCRHARAEHHAGHDRQRRERVRQAVGERKGHGNPGGK